MRIVVIGANGQLGSALRRTLDADDLIPLDLPACDVTDPVSVESALASRTFDVVVNLASFNRVGDAENDPAPAFTVNADGAENIARCAARRGVPVCYVSTDYVFGADETRAAPYTETDEPGPINAYGRSKLEGERAVQGKCPDHLIVRTSGLYGGASGKGYTFPQAILRQAGGGGPLRVVNDQTMSPTYAADLARRIVELLDAGARGIIHASNSGGCTWYELACETLRLAGVSAPVEPITADEYGSPAKRPHYSVLASNRLGEFGLPPLRPWAEALRDYLPRANGRGEPS